MSGQPGALGIAALPQLDSGPFLSYAWQWITFGVMAIGGLGYFTWRELKPGGALTPEGRARRKAEKEALRRGGRDRAADRSGADRAEEEGTGSAQDRAADRRGRGPRTG